MRLIARVCNAVFLAGFVPLFLHATAIQVRADSVCDVNIDGVCDDLAGGGAACVRDGKHGICVQRSSGCNCEAALPVEGGILDDFPATCWLDEANGLAYVFMRACNDTGETLYGVTPTRLTVSTTGTASAEFRTVPGWRRELVDGNCVNFKTTIQVSGCGSVDLHGDVTAEDPEGVTYTTGVAYCGSMTLECRPPTPTRTPIIMPTPRPTRTPLFTATPRPALPTPTPKPTKQQPTLRPTRTPLFTATPRIPLPTPTAKPAKEQPTLRPTRTPLFTATPRPVLPTPTAKPPKERPTMKPTRTPIPTPTSGPFLADQFTGRCIAINPHSARVTVFLQIFNNTGETVFNIVPGELEIATYGDVMIESINGPVPRMIHDLADRHSSRFEWTITASGTGQIITHAIATGVGGDGQSVVVSTGRQECNVLNIPAR